MSCKFLYTFLLFLAISNGLFSQEVVNDSISSEVIVIGCTHFEKDSLNADSVLNVLLKLKPAIILLESDHTNFHDDYSIAKSYDENEWNASLAYKEIDSTVMIRPFEFEGRKKYRLERGLHHIGLAWHYFHHLDRVDSLNENDQKIWDRYSFLKDTVDVIADWSLFRINRMDVDHIIHERQFYQYHRLKEIVKSHIGFDQLDTIPNSTLVKSKRQLFLEYVEFEEMRNWAMTQNILKWIRTYPKKRIVVLTGLFHRFPLRQQLSYYQKVMNFKLKEYWEL